MARLWEKLVSSCVIEEFGRKDVHATSKQQPPPNEEFCGLFDDASAKTKTPDPAAPSQVKKQAEERAAWHAKIDKVKDRNKFVGLTPRGIEDLSAERALLLELWRKDMWARVDDTWAAGVMPEGALLRVKSSGKYVWNLRSYRCALLQWPAQEVAPEVWGFDMTIKELEWRVIFSLDCLEEVPLESLAPAALFLADPTATVKISMDIHRYVNMII